MFQKKNVLFVLAIGFFIATVGVVSFAQETIEDEEEIVPVDTTEAYIPASYQPVELVREFGAKFCDRAGQFVFSLDNKIIYVSELLTYRILAFDKEGGVLFSFGGRKPEYEGWSSKSGEQEEDARRKEYEEENRDRFASLMGIGGDRKGNIYAADFGGDVVKVFTPEGGFIMVVPMEKELQERAPGRGSGGVAVNSRGDICVTDSPNARIQVNDSNGKYKYQIRGFRDKNGVKVGLCTVTNPRVNSFDELYVIDPIVCRIYRFSVDGDYLSGFGYMGDGAGGFNAPCGLAIDRLDRVYVIDRGFDIVQVFSREGKFLFALCDKKGRKIDIPFVMGISVDSDNLIYVSTGGRVGDPPMKVFKYLTK